MAEEKKKEQAEAEAKPAAAPAASGNKKTIFIAVGVAVLILAIGAPVTYFALKPKEQTSESLTADAAAEGENALVQEGVHDEDELLEGEESLGAFFPFETFVVNLAGGRYIRLQVQIEFTSRDVPKRFYPRLVPIRDTMINLLAGRTQDDLLNEKGRESLKKDIRDIINETLRSEDVRRVYFTQFVVQ
jgi:flagellar FliL protein